MKKIILGILVLLSVSVLGCILLGSCWGGTLSERAQAEIKADIIATIKRQDAAWNRGDIDAFMEDYVKSDTLRFASGGSAQYGWQTTLERYKARYPDRATMGTLVFSDLEIDVFSKTDALVFGRWALERENDRPGGLYTLHMKNIEGAWKIQSDHTSSKTP